MAVEVDYLETSFWKVFWYLADLKDNPKFVILWLWKISLQAPFCHCLMIWLKFVVPNGDTSSLAAIENSILCLNPRRKLIPRRVNDVLFCAKGTICKSLGFDFENCCPCYRDQLDHVHGLVCVGWSRHGKREGCTWRKHDQSILTEVSQA